MMLEALAELGVAAALNSNSPALMSRNSFQVAVTETREGFYKSYDVEKTEQVYDDASSRFKTAEQTEEGGSKYWAILAVLVFGSFAIPMVQYYWYVADEDDDDE